MKTRWGGGLADWQETSQKLWSDLLDAQAIRAKGSADKFSGHGYSNTMI